MDTEKQLDAIRGLKKRVPPMTYKKLQAVILEKPVALPKQKMIYDRETLSRFSEIVKTVGKVCKIEPRIITIRTRIRVVVDAKCLVIHHVLHLFRSLAEVADQFEGFSHADILFHKKRYIDLCEVDSRFREKAEKVNELINKRTI